MGPHSCPEWQEEHFILDLGFAVVLRALRSYLELLGTGVSPYPSSGALHFSAPSSARVCSSRMGSTVGVSDGTQGPRQTHNTARRALNGEETPGLCPWAAVPVGQSCQPLPVLVIPGWIGVVIPPAIKPCFHLQPSELAPPSAVLFALYYLSMT